ncbi:MAG: heme exporter protein [Clostridia bacterium]|nr:ABC-type transport system involved in cytochrome c biosis, permease component [Clostridiales bacterium]MDK2986329.1 heme exporter protein [Clostridia bacterium]
MSKKLKGHTFLGWLTFAMIIFALYMALVHAPVERVMGVVQKIFYFHVASAWNAFFAFFVVFVASIIFLKTRNRKWDIIAKVSAEIGVVFTTIVLVSGPIWARSAWNRWWVWEPRLTTTLILWFIYLAYILIRSASIEEDKKGVLAAAFGIIGFLDVPVVFFAIRWWGSLYHPEVVKGSGGGLHPAMFQALIACVVAFTFLYFYFLQKGIFIELSRLRIEKIKEELRAEN